MSELFYAVMALYKALGAPGGNLRSLGRMWDYAVGDYRIWVNACETDQQTDTGASVPFGHLYIEFNGWPFALLTATQGGEIGGGELANEDNCLAAIWAEAERLIPGVRAEFMQGVSNAE